MWLWRESEDIYFAVGYRVTEAPFVEFESEAQFAPAARRLAGIAARKVIDYRGLFPELATAARYLDQQTRRHGEPNDAFDAGSPGLIGDRRTAERAFNGHDSLVAAHLESWESLDWFRADEAHYRAEAKHAYGKSERFRSLEYYSGATRGEVSAITEPYVGALKVRPPGEAVHCASELKPHAMKASTRADSCR